jgi:hypothetical protein
MPHIDPNSLAAGIHGSIGNIVIVHHNGRVWTRTKPSVTPEPTPSRIVHRSKIALAGKWTKSLKEKAPEVVARYRVAAEGTPWTWQNVAVSDYMHGPVIEDIDLSGYTGATCQPIRVQARDDVPPPMKLGVAEVQIALRNASGQVLEKGGATAEGNIWTYLAQTEVPLRQIITVEVTVLDQPLHSVTRTVPHLVGRG